MNAFARAIAAVALTALVAAGAEAAPLRVFATTPDLGSLAREVGGDEVRVFVMGSGREDPHFLQARPSFLKELSAADVYLQAGLELELGYAPLLLRNARNGKVLPGSPGYLDASTAIVPQQASTAPVDRSMGDVHPLGNPHYLTDPVNGLRVARFLADGFARLRPEKEAYFRERFEDFKKRLGAALFGPALAAKYDPEKLAALADYGKLDSFLRQQGDLAALGGWMGAMAPHRGTRFVDDHMMWIYFSNRFSLENVGHLEPKPGLPPSTAHIQRLIEDMQANGARLILAAPYYDPRHAAVVAEATGAVVVPVTHQVGGRDGADDYLSAVDHNVRAVVDAIEKRGK